MHAQSLRHKPPNSTAKATQWDGTAGRVISTASNNIFVLSEGFAGLGEGVAGKSEKIADGGEGFANGGGGVTGVGNALAQACEGFFAPSNPTSLPSLRC